MPRTLAAACLPLLVLPVVAQPKYEPERAATWEKEIAAIEKRQAESPPAKGGIVFAGSSTVRLWDLAKAFPDWKATNSGFGGSEIRDVTHFADRVILKHQPRAIVFYAGDNDINSGRTPDQVVADFRSFAEAVHARLSKTKVFFISVKPSVRRWKQFDAQSKANKLVREFCGTDERLGYIDVVPAMLGGDGKPRPDLFVKDGLHLSAKGYEILNEAVRKAVK
jgi:lysophospholipase L1-like esterase